MGGARMRSFGGLSARVRVGGVASLAAVAFALASAQPAGAVLGGGKVPITATPWQAEIATLVIHGEILEGHYCGGVVVSERWILTAAHCVIDPQTGLPITPGRSLELGPPIEEIGAVAGTSDPEDEEEPTKQPREVTAVRVDPNFTYISGAKTVSPDDLAVVEVSEPFAFNAAVQPIALASAGSQLSPGTAVALSGFGEGNTELDNTLSSLNTTLVPRGECGSEAGAFLCASTPNGSTCIGDSGSGLTLPGPPATLIGLVDRAEPLSGSETCKLGAADAFVNLTDPAIREFIGTIPAAQQSTTKSPSKEESKTLETPKTQEPVGKSSLRVAATKLTLSGGNAVVKLDCSGTATCKGKLALTAVKIVKVKGKKRKETVTIGTESFSVAGGRTAKIKIKLSSYARAQIKSTHGHLKASLSILGLETEPTHKRTEAVTIS